MAEPFQLPSDDLHILGTDLIHHDSEAEPSQLPVDPKILGTDSAPNEAQASSLHALIEQQEEEMDRLDVEIALLVARLDELRAQKASVHHSYAANKAMITPVSRLPPEILGEIFLHCLEFPFDWESKYISLHEAPLFLMRVCRWWRQVATGTPRLWTELELGRWLEVDPCHIIPMWLSNSGALPINVTMATGWWSSNWNKGAASRLVVESFHRYRHFSGPLDVHLYDELYRRRGAIHAPLLESLEIYFSSAAPVPTWPIEDCIHAPQLAAISMDDPILMDIISFNPMTLRSITLDECDFSAAPPSLNFMTSCCNVSFLKVPFYEGMQLPIVEGGSRLLLQSLETLVIDLWFNSDPCPLLDTIEAPALRWFQLYPHGYQEEDIIVPVMAAVESLLGQDPPLSGLYLSHVNPIDWPRLFEMLPSLQNLHYLDLRDCAVEDSILQALTLDSSSPSSSRICPRLIYLNVTGAVLSRDLFVTLVRSRAPIDSDAAVTGRGYLRNVTVDTQLPKSAEDDSHLTALKDIAQICGGLLKITCWRPFDMDRAREVETYP